MRRADPCWYDPRLKAFVTTRYQDIKRVLRDADFSSERVAQFVNGAPPHLQTKVDTYVTELSRWLIFRDPPHHTILRNRLLQSMGPRFLPLVASAAAEAVTEALRRIERSKTSDVIHDFAAPVPTRVLARLLGISDSDIESFKNWTNDIFTLMGSGVADEGAVEVAYRGVTDLRRFVLNLLRQKRQAPAEDVLSSLANSGEGEGMSSVPDEDIVGMIMALIVAGHDSTTSLIGNALKAILSDPQQRDWVSANRNFPDGAVDELIRFDGPILSVARRAKCDVLIAGHFVSQGSFLINLLIAGNRDPREFSEPEKLNFNRQESDHVGFGVGIHQCVGAPIARAVMREAVPRFIQRFPLTEVAEGCVWLRNLSNRGLATMPVKLNQSAPAISAHESHV
jgi:cytochrome P450